jgi:hypothetical protein
VFLLECGKKSENSVLSSGMMWSGICIPNDIGTGLPALESWEKPVSKSQCGVYVN